MRSMTHCLLAALVAFGLVLFPRALDHRSDSASLGSRACSSCNDGCQMAYPTPSTGGSCIEWIEVPTGGSGDCDPITYPNPPCLTEDPCTLQGVLKFKLTCGGTWDYRVHDNGNAGQWTNLTYQVPVTVYFEDELATRPCGFEDDSGWHDGLYLVEFRYWNSPGSTVSSTARFEFRCSVCEGVDV